VLGQVWRLAGRMPSLRVTEVKLAI
jgi:hypothetical protein